MRDSNAGVGSRLLKCSYPQHLMNRSRHAARMSQASSASMLRRTWANFAQRPCIRRLYLRLESVSEAGDGKLAEGAYTARILDQIAKARGVDMPIVAAMAAILDGKLSVDDAVTLLMNRPIKGE